MKVNQRRDKTFHYCQQNSKSAAALKYLDLKSIGKNHLNAILSSQVRKIDGDMAWKIALIYVKRSR